MRTPPLSGRRIISGIALSVTALFAFFSGCTKSESVRKSTFFALDTYITIQLVHTSGRACKQVFKKAENEAQRIQDLMSAHAKVSEIWRLNHRPKGENRQELIPEICRLISVSQSISEKTGGAFDITIAPVKWLWGFGGDLNPALPDSGQIDSALAFVNYKAVSINLQKDSISFGKSGVQIDLGGIAKGHAIKRLSGMIEKAGITSYLIEAGGDVFGKGHKPNGHPWKIGLQHPRKRGELSSVFELSSGTAVVTSGDYERFFEQDGRRYHHLFDPASGYPAHKCISATVFCDDPILADAYSTAVFVMGPEKGMELLDEHANLEGILFSENDAGKRIVHLSDGLKNKIEIEN